MTPGYGVAIDVGWLVGVELGVGVNGGVAMALDTGVVPIVGNGVTGKTFVGVPGNVGIGIAVGVDPPVCVLCVALKLLTMTIAQMSRARKTTPPPIATWSARRWDRYQRHGDR